MKKYGRFFIAALFSLVCLAGSAWAAEPVTVLCGGFPLALEAEAENGVTMVPLSAFCDETGAVAKIEQAVGGENIITVTRGGHMVSTSVGYDALSNEQGEKIPLPCPVERRGAVIYVPLRGVAEALGIAVGWDGEAGAVTLERPQKQVEVSTVRELVDAVAPDTEILLAPGVYDFSTLDWRQTMMIYVTVEDVLSGGGFDVVIRDVTNLTLRGGEGVCLVTPYRYADVLRFQDCTHVRVEGVFAKHDVEPGYCLGDVLEFDDCKYVTVKDCTLDGSGTYGVSTRGTNWLRVEDCVVSNCSYGAFDFSGRHIVVIDTLVENCRKFSLVSLWDSRDVLFENCTFRENEVNELVECRGALDVLFRDCTFSDNIAGTEVSLAWKGGGAVFENCVGLEDVAVTETAGY